jgi:PAS domain-containing protein
VSEATKPRITMKQAKEPVDPRLHSAARLEALRVALQTPDLAIRLTRVTRWAALGARCDSAFIAWVLPANARLMALYNIAPNPRQSEARGLPKRLELVLPAEFLQTRALGDLEEIAALLHLGMQPGFFATHPIYAGNELLGALCVMDRVPRQLDANAQQLMAELAGSITALDAVSASAAPQNSERDRVRTLGQQLPVLLLSLDANARIRHIEGRLLKELQLEASSVLGLNAFEVFGRQPAISSAMREALNGQSQQCALSWRGHHFLVWLTPAEQDGNPDGLLGLALDITAFRESPRDD